MVRRISTKLWRGLARSRGRHATLLTIKLPFDEWTEIFGSKRLTGTLLDRLPHHVSILKMNGNSYGLAKSRT